jgi:hypothetical protein
MDVFVGRMVYKQKASAEFYYGVSHMNNLHRPSLGSPALQLIRFLGACLFYYPFRINLSFHQARQ